MINDIIAEAKSRMSKSIDAYRHELTKMRTGRAHPSLLEGLMVSYYGSPTPLKQAANIVVEDARTLSVTPYDKSLVGDIDKAIRNSDLGLNPATAGQVIRVPLPPLTEDRRKELVKQMRQIAEQARVAVRNIRKDANKSVKTLLKDKEISEDEERRAEDQVQKLTDQKIEEIDKVAQEKETDLMQV